MRRFHDVDVLGDGYGQLAVIMAVRSDFGSRGSTTDTLGDGHKRATDARCANRNETVAEGAAWMGIANDGVAVSRSSHISAYSKM